MTCECPHDCNRLAKYAVVRHHMEDNKKSARGFTSTETKLNVCKDCVAVNDKDVTLIRQEK